MTQISLLWDGASVGDADALTVNAADGIGYRMANAGYQSYFIDRLFRATWNGTGNRGVLKNWNMELAVTGVVTPLQVDTGAAVIYGLFYENDAAANVVITSPTSDTRYDRIVIRRDWAAQTARMVHLVGTEGSYTPPALTQSPAPDGSGIYDIPLASFSVTTGGAIAVTDEREYCLYPTGFAVDAFGNTQLANSSVDWLDRAVRSKVHFLGAGDLQPNVNTGYVTYDWGGVFDWSTYNQTQVGPPVWGGAANDQAWQCVGTSANYRGLYGSTRMPADYAGGPVYAYLWWTANVSVAQTWYAHSIAQFYKDGLQATFSGISSSYISGFTPAVSDVFRTLVLTFTPAVPDDDEMIHLYVAYRNTSGTEDTGIMGVELLYEGYT